MSRKLKILVLEDEPSLVDALVYALSQDGFEARSCQTIKEARTLLESEFFSLALFDIGLPDGSGLDLLKEIRTDSALPIILLTAKTSEIDRILGLELGADDYVGKPFSPREVVARVKAVLRRTEKEGATDVKSLESFQIDEQRKIISFRNNQLTLSRYEYRILSSLIARPGWVMSREKLMNLCWDEPDSSLERTVDTHIKTIRAKLKEIDPKQDIIITHRGLGYSLKEDL